jgi:small subunit ribosomal protein S20
MIELSPNNQGDDLMPRRKSSVDSTRVGKKRHLRNIRVKTAIKKIIKKYTSALAAKNTAEAQKLLPELYSQLDKAAKKRIVHPATANRRKSRLTLSLKAKS